MAYVNDVIEHRDSGTRFRIISIDYQLNEAWVFPVGKKNQFPWRLAASEIEGDGKGAQFSLVVQKVEQVTLKPSAAAIAARDRAYKLIRPLVRNPAILLDTQRNRLINERAEETKSSPRTIVKHLRAWWNNGQTPNVLLPKFHTRGSTSGTTARRGRPVKYGARPIYQIVDEDKKRIKKTVEATFLRGEKYNLRDAYIELLARHYTYTDNEGKARLNNPGHAPSMDQFRRVFKELFPYEKIIRARKGDAEFENNHASKTGSLQAATYTVGDVFEIDATVADIFCVATSNRGLIVGKPTLYLIIDRKSALIVGFYIGFENASWPAARQAILSICEDKRQLCEFYNVEYDPNDWPAHGVFPKEFIADRGEMISRDSTRLVDGLEVTIRNLPPQLAKHKPLVECGFKLLHRSIAPVVEGYEPPANVMKRQGRHYDKDACLTIRELSSIVLQAIIQANRSPRKPESLLLSEILNGVLPTPTTIWNVETRRRAGALPRLSIDQVRYELLENMPATVKREGVHIGKRYYSCIEIEERGWLVIAGRASFSVTVSFERRLVDTIYIHDDQNPGSVFVATLTKQCAEFQGLSWREAEAIEYVYKRSKAEAKQTKLQNDFELHQFTKAVSKKAKQEMQAVSKGKSRSSRKKDIVQDRHEERREERKSTARLGSPWHSVPPTDVESVVGMARDNAVTSPAPEQTEKDLRRRKKYEDMLNGK